MLAGPASTIDAQASHHDARGGLPESVSAAVARAIVEQANAGADDLVLELGACTGEIGIHLAHVPVHYIGLDASAAMLDVFRARAAEALPTRELENSAAHLLRMSEVLHEERCAQKARVLEPPSLVPLPRTGFIHPGVVVRAA